MNAFIAAKLSDVKQDRRIIFDGLCTLTCRHSIDIARVFLGSQSDPVRKSARETKNEPTQPTSLRDRPTKFWSQCSCHVTFLATCSPLPEGSWTYRNI